MWAWRLFLAGVFLTPFVLARPIPGFVLTFGDAALILGGLYLIFKRKAPPRNAAENLAFVVPTLLISAGLGLSTAVGQYSSPRNLIDAIVQYFFVLIFLSAAVRKLSRTELRQTMGAYLAGGMACIGIGLLLNLFLPGVEDSFVSMGWIETTPQGRLGMFAGVNTVALVGVDVVAFAYYLYMRGSIGLLTVSGANFLGLAAVITTQSGGGLITLATAILIIITGQIASRERGESRFTGRKLFLISVTSIAAAFVSLNWLQGQEDNVWEKFQGRVVTPFEEGGLSSVGSAEVRLELNRLAWDYISESPVVGYGSSFFNAALGTANPHVTPIGLWLDGGLLALMGWLLLALSLVALVFRAFRRDRAVAITTAVAASSFVLYTLNMPGLYQRVAVLPVTLVFYLVARNERDEEGPKSAAPPTRRRPRHSARATSVRRGALTPQHPYVRGTPDRAQGGWPQTYQP